MPHNNGKYPFLWTVLSREAVHRLTDTAVKAIFTGGSVIKVSIDPDQGGCTQVVGGHAGCILAAGYIGSTLFGGLFIMAGFDTLVSKIVSFIIGLGLIAPLAVVQNKLCVIFSCYGCHEYQVLIPTSSSLLASELYFSLYCMKVFSSGSGLSIMRKHLTPYIAQLHLNSSQSSSSMVLSVRRGHEVIILFISSSLLCTHFFCLQSALYVVCAYLYFGLPGHV